MAVDLNVTAVRVSRFADDEGLECDDFRSYGYRTTTCMVQGSGIFVNLRS